VLCALFSVLRCLLFACCFTLRLVTHFFAAQPPYLPPPLLPPSPPNDCTTGGH
jgi:hypothetical protein